MSESVQAELELAFVWEKASVSELVKEVAWLALVLELGSAWA